MAMIESRLPIVDALVGLFGPGLVVPAGPCLPRPCQKVPQQSVRPWEDIRGPETGVLYV